MLWLYGHLYYRTHLYLLTLADTGVCILANPRSAITRMRVKINFEGWSDTSACKSLSEPLLSLMRFSLVFAVKTVGLVFILVTVANLLLCEWGLKNNNGEIAFKQDKSYTVRQATKLSPHIVELFPAHMNTTDISQSSFYHNFHGSSIRQESSEKKRDIFQVLARWDNLSGDFLPSHVPHNKVLTGYEWRKTSPYEKYAHTSLASQTLTQEEGLVKLL